MPRQQRQHRQNWPVAEEAPPREARPCARLRRKRERALDAAASASIAARYGIGPAATESQTRALSAERKAARIESIRLNALLEDARSEARRTDAERHRLAVENAHLHAGYADALDRLARLMVEREALTAQNAALRARLARGGADG